MKTTIKITAIAVITILAALACSEGVSLSSRDYKEYNESHKADYTNSPSGTAWKPNITASLIYSTGSVAEQNKEIKINFPEEADILRETNANIDSKLQEFLKFYQYSNPATPPSVYTPSTLGTEVTYSFVRREGNDIIVKAGAIPNIKKIVWKIDASKYKCFGQVIDFNEDGTGGESYDDQYGTLDITGSAVDITGYDTTFIRPEETLDIGIDASFGGTFTTASSSSKVILLNTGASGADNAQMRKIINDIKGKFELQKYNQTDQKWEKVGSAELYEYVLPVPAEFAGWGTDRLYVNITPEDLGIYRIKADGIANLTSSENYGEKPAKLKVFFTPGYATPDYDSDPYKFKYKTVYSNPVSYYNFDIHQWQITSPVSVSNVVVSSDAAKKNVVLEVFFSGIMDTLASPSANVYLEELPLADFNKAVKLVYRKDLFGSEIPSGTALNDGIIKDNIVELKITDVKYEISKQLDATNNNRNYIKITLDPSYQINGNRAISILLSPGFKYAGNHVTFGDNCTTNSVMDTYYNGSFFWRSYGQLVNGL